MLDREQRGRAARRHADLGVKEIGSIVDVTEFDLVSFTSNDTDVVATLHWTFTVNATGRTASMYTQHWWRFGGGKIVFFRGSEDSAQTVAAFSS